MKLPAVSRLLLSCPRRLSGLTRTLCMRLPHLLTPSTPPPHAAASPVGPFDPSPPCGIMQASTTSHTPHATASV